MERIVIASNNADKLHEMRSLLLDLKVTVVPQQALGVPEADETGLSFIENAILKARNACRHSGLPAVADDSGIEVDALNGAPGIRSARFAGEHATDAENRNLLLREMSQKPSEQRSARFQCAVALLKHPEDPTPLICQGTWEGQLLTEARGEHGFGYDPIFYVPSHDCSAAELAPDIKNRLSHRGQALRSLIAVLSR
ncbi:MAG: RdgB/HAM1 family non-canonical purine NTP pyrophosphatase [Gammaproteobacteria bacterium]|nr:RdgB/HAM1 family non-canonical purine NTP pyrophosphatase [Gammaproteobacteria bacterium]